jgi:hypothetical protein
MAFREPPASETELLQRRPASFRADSFPRHWLSADERILFETRPGVLGLYWGRLTIAILWALLFVGTALSPTTQDQTSFAEVAVVFAVPPFVAIFFAWRGYAYALTDRRVLATSGMISRSLEYARYDEVQGLTVGTSVTDDIRFALGAPGTAPKGRAAAGRPKKIVWKSVSLAPQVYEFVQDAFRFEGLQEAQRRAKTAFVQRALRTRIVCEYCGSLIEFDPDHPTPSTICPTCGAPIRLATG